MVTKVSMVSEEVMELRQLLEKIDWQEFQGDPGVKITGLSYDSRSVKPGFLFVALRGHRLDGHNFLENAARNGAVAVVGEEFECRDLGGISRVRVKDSRRALSKLATVYYGYPFSGLNLIGITGTNGKTTTSYLLESILCKAGANPGVIGTINYRCRGNCTEAPVTTPESLDLMRILRHMKDKGVTDVIMEISSHALDQGRTRDCPFKVALFTNISRDHMDYHGSMKSYFEAKSRLFVTGKGEVPEKAVINLDDPKGQNLARMTDAEVITYGLGEMCDVRAENVEVSKSGLTAMIIAPSWKTEINSPLLGDFNIYNILAASAVAFSMGISSDAISAGIAGLSGVPGRLEAVANERSLTLVVDYAHTPDALSKALRALRPLARGKVITVFGCGGDRDKGKRCEMGYVAAKYSDIVFITSDNPRTEDPLAIVSEIEKGVKEVGTEYLVDLDRAQAIWAAVKRAGKEDVVLIAGKGHEDYQIVGKERKDFDDRKVAAEAASSGE